MGKSKHIQLTFLSTLCWLLLGCYLLWKVKEAPIGDFANYYYATQAYLADAPVTDTYEPYAFNIWVNEQSPAPVFVNYAPVPPISILAYLPFSLFKTVGAAKFWFSLIGLGVFGWVYFWIVGSWESGVGSRGSEVEGRKSKVESRNLGSTMDRGLSTDNTISQELEVESRGSEVESPKSGVESQESEVEGRKSEVESRNLGDTMDRGLSTDNTISQELEVESRGSEVESPKSGVKSRNLGDTMDHGLSTDNLPQQGPRTTPPATSPPTYNSRLTTHDSPTYHSRPTTHDSPTYNSPTYNLQLTNSPTPQLTTLLLPFLLYTPLLNNLYQGQSYLYLLAALLAGYQFWETGRRNWAAVCWAIPIALKIFPAILLLFLLLKRDWRTFILTSALAAGLSFLPVLFIPIEVMVDYFVHILPRLFAGEINDPFTILYQSARVVFDQLFVFDQHLNSGPITDNPVLSQYLYLFFQLCILGIVMALVNDKKVSAFVGFGIVILGGLLVSGYGSSYSMLLLLIPLLALSHLALKNWQIGLAMFLLFLAGNSPIYRLQDWPLVFQFPRLYALIAFLVFLFILIRARLNAKPLLLLLALLLIKQWVSGGKDSHQVFYFLPDGQHVIIHDYEATEEGILLHYFNVQGAQQETLPTTDELQFDPKLQIRNQQIFLGDQQLTFTKSRKKKPMRLNDKAVIYLSDEGRGVGFYTLRKINY